MLSLYIYMHTPKMVSKIKEMFLSFSSRDVPTFQAGKLRP